MKQLVEGGAADDLGTRVEELRRGPDPAGALAALLPESQPIHRGRSPAEIGRLRGYLFAAFADTGLPDVALPYVVESLETGDIADEVAGAAIAVRGRATPPPGIVASLQRAVANRAGVDTTVSFERFAPEWPYSRPTSALTEVVRTLGHVGRHDPTALDVLTELARDRDRFPSTLLQEIDDVLRDGAASTAAHGGAEPAASGPEHSCCAAAEYREPVPDGVRRSSSTALVEDQDGRQGGLDDCLRGRPSVVAFFYTRCDNPLKCSLTIRGLATVRDILEDRRLLGRVQVAALTYDPDFDIPERLARYGRDRGMTFGPHARFLRVISGFPEVRRRFDLGVSYGGSTVNRHRIEAHVLDADGTVAVSFTRRRFVPDVVCDAVEGLLDGAR